MGLWLLCAFSIAEENNRMPFCVLYVIKTGVTENPTEYIKIFQRFVSKYFYCLDRMFQNMCPLTSRAWLFQSLTTSE